MSFQGGAVGGRPWHVAAAEQVGGPEQVGVVAQFAGQAGEADPAAFHDVGVVGQAERDGGELLDQQHAGALDSATAAITGISRLTTTGARPRESSSISR